MKTAYSYLRWSTALQGKEGRDSKTRQTNSAKEWIQNHSGGDYVLSTDVFIDPGKSGYKGEHIEKDAYGRAKGELLRFIELVEDGTIKQGSILLVDSFDRFSRLPPMKSLELFTRVINSGIGLVFTGSRDKRVIDEALITKDGYILQFIVGEMLRSFEESAEKSRKIKAAKQAKLAQLRAGLIVSHNNVPKYLSFDKTTNTYKHNENTAYVVRMAKDFLAGNSLYAITKKFNAEGVKTFRRGFHWSPKSCKCILQNRVLLGEFLGNKHFCEPIIDQQSFDQIQSLLAKNKWKVSGRDGIHLVNIFRGLAFCSECGQAMQVSHQTIDPRTKKPLKRPYRYFRCCTSSKAQLCANRQYMRAKQVETEFFMSFLMQTPEGLISGNNEEAKSLEREIAAKQAQKNRVDNQIQKLVAVNESLNIEQLTEQLTKLKTLADALKKETDALSANLRQVQGSPVDYTEIKSIVAAAHAKRFADGPEYDQFDAAVHAVEEMLEDNETRKRIRLLLPSLIGSVKLFTQVGDSGSFQVLDRQGKVVFESLDM